MSNTPNVSVIMGVYNGTRTLDYTLRSIFSQEGCDFECIVVDDGSTDGTSSILQAWTAREERLRVITQPNLGLTRALMTGCNAANGAFIARQDCGDASLPGRFKQQYAILKSQTAVVMVACGARFIGPGGETLSEITTPGTSLQAGLNQLDVQTVKGPPHHGSTMFRADAYRRVGGYRHQFTVAQDLDLWLRLAEVGTCLGQPEIHYQASVDAGGISTRRRKEQLRLAGLAVACAKARRSRGNDSGLLEQVGVLVEAASSRLPISRAEMARHLYFVGCNLRNTDPAQARRYFRRAALQNPIFLRALWRSFMG